jgi:hypothetical protein
MVGGAGAENHRLAQLGPFFYMERRSNTDTTALQQRQRGAGKGAQRENHAATN